MHPRPDSTYGEFQVLPYISFVTPLGQWMGLAPAQQDCALHFTFPLKIIGTLSDFGKSKWTFKNTHTQRTHSMVLSQKENKLYGTDFFCDEGSLFKFWISRTNCKNILISHVRSATLHKHHSLIFHHIVLPHSFTTFLLPQYLWYLILSCFHKEDSWIHYIAIKA